MEIIRSKIQFDLVVPLPSSANLSKIVCRACVRAGDPVPHVHALRKITVRNALHQAQQYRKLSGSKDLDRLIRSLKASSQNAIFQMKELDRSERRIMNPFEVDVAQTHHLAGANVLLTDDIASSGRSLSCAAQLCVQYGAASVVAVCLLSQNP
ncbi:phosphoribosyltransferase [Agrobacterium tumefaciens]|uniref:Phosphoribosyltransferase n=2 Tax=Agrobacterium TaxID=357 RepID=A0AAF0KGK0_AGRTU|nr:phosphoribosyltransferase [Agrobacterium tumefaciens]WGM61736.1 phosphoribosyltransferase [Agrobacterium tumefaciens]